MKLIAPNYYPSFRCIADKCRHSCCIGWEIDVDPDTRAMYRQLPGAFGERLNAAIDDSGEVSVFRLGPDERCPLLNSSGLCDLITALGEDALCQICADHPRFRNAFADRTEIGLGLCCEAAAMLVMAQQSPMTLIVLEDDGQADTLPEEEAALLALRDELIRCMQDESRSLSQRLNALLDAAGFALPDRDWAAFYRTLERLDKQWDAALDKLPDRLPAAFPALEAQPALVRALSNFCVYLLYRHLPGALEDEDIPGRIAFCVLSTRMLAALCAAHPGCTPVDCAEYARMYSAEIEYSEDNLAALLDALWEE